MMEPISSSTSLPQHSHLSRSLYHNKDLPQDCFANDDPNNDLLTNDPVIMTTNIDDHLAGRKSEIPPNNQNKISLE